LRQTLDVPRVQSVPVEGPAAGPDALSGSLAGRSPSFTPRANGHPCTLTIVVANYNHGHFLPRCLEAIAAQTRAPDEVILIDDASTDESVAIAAPFAARLPRFRIVRHEANRGVVATMNEGLAEAQSTHVLFAAADDWIEPDLVAVSMGMIEQFHDAGLCSSLTRLAVASGEIIGPFRSRIPLRKAGYIAPAQVKRLLIDDEAWFNGNTAVLNRSAALACGGYRGELKAFTDMFLNVELALRHGACFIPRFLGVWRRSESGYASSLIADPSAMLTTFEAVRRLMTNGGTSLFTSEHVRRWSGRWRFTASRGVVAASPPTRREWLPVLLAPDRHHFAPLVDWLAGLPLMGPSLAIAALFALLRAPDLITVVRRRLEWALYGRRLERVSP
jgi:Glycosyl transferase family 2